MALRVTLIPGDGIGPELAEATRRVLDASGVAFDWEVVDAGEAVMGRYGTPLPEHVLESIKRNRVALKGPITTPVGEGFRSVNVTLPPGPRPVRQPAPCPLHAGARHAIRGRRPGHRP
jgi:isocitrate dehydrogenase (NAD+)